MTCPPDQWNLYAAYMGSAPWTVPSNWVGAAKQVCDLTGLIVPQANQVGWENAPYPFGNCCIQCYQGQLGWMMNTSRFPVPASTLAFFQANYLFSAAKMVKPWANGGKALEMAVQAQVPWLWRDGQSIQIGLGGALSDTRNNIPLYFGAEVMTYPGVGAEGVGFDGGCDYLSLRYAPGTAMNTNTAIGVTTTAKLASAMLLVKLTVKSPVPFLVTLVTL